MSITQKLFSFNGRLRRRDYWIFSILIGVVAGIVYTVLGMVMGGSAANVDPNDAAAVQAAASGMLMTALPVIGITFLVTLWPYLALVIKRLHDRDRPAIFVLLSFIPIVNLWIAIEVLFLDGTPGPNRYGPSPKGIGGSSEAFA